MPASTTPEAVQAVIETELDTQPFIDAATAFYNDTIGQDGLPESLGNEVLRWLAAHFVAVADPRESRESVGTGSWSFEGKNATGTGLESTQHGQTAMQLDTTGKLRSSQYRKARMMVL